MDANTRDAATERRAGDDIVVAALYRFAPWPDYASCRAPLTAVARAAGVKGTLLLAAEGINGTIAGTEAGIADVLASLRALPGFAGLDVKYSRAPAMPFGRLKVRLKREIVTMGVDGIDPLKSVGTYVAPADWNALISDPETLVVDTRNAYEVSIGTFAGAHDPGTRSFREFPAWIAQRLADGPRPRRIAMFCTGGIRCEKATAYVRQLGVEEVYHLEGGILKYLETVDEATSLWRGECFVFDERVSVGHGLKAGTHKLCHACGKPVEVAGETGGGFIDDACDECRAGRASG